MVGQEDAQSRRHFIRFSLESSFSGQIERDIRRFNNARSRGPGLLSFALNRFFVGIVSTLGDIEGQLLDRHNWNRHKCMFITPVRKIM